MILLFRFALLAILAAAAVTAPAIAMQAQPQEVDAQRLKAARQVISLYYPEDRREEDLRKMLEPMMQTIERGILQSPEMATMAEENPKKLAVFQDFLAEETESSLLQLNKNVPALLDAMAQAYARKMTAEELNALYQYLSTPSGQAFINTSTGIFADPDVMRTQQTMMTESFATMGERMKKLADKFNEINDAELQKLMDEEQ